MNKIKEIESKYFKKTAPADNREQLGQNLQADINKIDGIIRRIVDKQASQSELNRLRSATVRLLSAIDNLSL